MQDFLNELTSGLPDALHIERTVIRLLVAALLGAVIGIQREYAQKPAGLRTHMLVSLGAALLIISCLEVDMSPSDLSRVVQGLAAGIGFLGAGAILKITEEPHDHWTDHRGRNLDDRCGRCFGRIGSMGNGGDRRVFNLGDFVGDRPVRAPRSRKIGPGKIPTTKTDVRS